MALRQDLKERGERLGITVCLGEEDDAINDAVVRDDPPGILEGCARLMGESDAFFGMLFERHGTGVRLAMPPGGAKASVSFFEAELLDASMTRKPICIVQSRALPPSPPMQEFLRLVSRNLQHHVVPVDQAELIETFETFCRLLVRGEAPGSPWLFDTVSLGRIRRAVAREAADPRLEFLSGLLREDCHGAFDEEVMRQSLARVEAGEAVDGTPLSQLEKLTYLWMAVRELARLPSRKRLHDYSEPLRRTLSLWNSSAAWYGLHGSHPMGCLAALNDLTYATTAIGSGELPLGPRSSAYYSIGTKLLAADAARRFYHQSLALAQRKLAQETRDPSEMWQMTASAQARLAQLGRMDRWRFALALKDFRKSLEWRIKNGASAASVGEAKNAYAFALFQLPWERRQALALAAEGSQLLRDSPGGTASGFYFRAERKRAEMLGRAGLLDEAIAVAGAARDLAATAQAFDQVTPLAELVTALEKRQRS